MSGYIMARYELPALSSANIAQSPGHGPGLTMVTTLASLSPQPAPHVFTSTKITEYHRKYSGCETNNLNSYLLELEPDWPFSSAFLSVQV